MLVPCSTKLAASKNGWNASFHASSAALLPSHFWNTQTGRSCWPRVPCWAGTTCQTDDWSASLSTGTAKYRAFQPEEHDASFLQMQHLSASSNNWDIGKNWHFFRVFSENCSWVFETINYSIIGKRGKNNTIWFNTRVKWGTCEGRVSSADDSAAKTVPNLEGSKAEVS